MGLLCVVFCIVEVCLFRFVLFVLLSVACVVCRVYRVLCYARVDLMWLFRFACGFVVLCCCVVLLLLCVCAMLLCCVCMIGVCVHDVLF